MLHFGKGEWIFYQLIWSPAATNDWVSSSESHSVVDFSSVENKVSIVHYNEK